MGKPSKVELDAAFQEAKRLIWQEQDKHFLAKSLFALSDQSEELYKLLDACEAYIKSGHSTMAHRRMVSAVNSFRNLYSNNTADYTVTISTEELNAALKAAGVMREHNNDPSHLAKSILNLNYIIRHLNMVKHSAERYIRSGMSDRELQNLENALKSYRRAENRSAGEDSSTYPVY